MLRQLTGHQFKTVNQMSWSGAKNGVLIDLAEGSFDLWITADQGIRYQQNTAGRKLAILVLPTNHWATLRGHIPEIQSAMDSAQPGTFNELHF
jgi:hypothetical protein